MPSLLCQNSLKSFLLACKVKATIAKIHAFIICTGMSLHNNTTNGLIIASYARIGEILHAREVFDKLPQRTVSAYNSMIVAYFHRNNPDEVLDLYDQMIEEGVRPDSSIFTVAIKACVSSMDMKMGETVWGKAVDCGYENDVFVCSSMLNLYAKGGKMDDALIVFDKMTRKDLVCWTILVTGYAQRGQLIKAIDIYKRMQIEGIEGDGVVMVGLIQACSDLGDLKTGRSIHGFMIRRRLPNDVVIKTSLVDMYAKNGDLEVACRVFNKMTQKNVISWAALISGFVQNGFATNALELLEDMQGYGFQPDLVSLRGTLLACSQVGSLKLGKSIHCYILKGHNLDQTSATTLIDMYSKCGALSCSRALFDRLDKKDLVSWNTMIASYGIHGNGKEALSIFLQMTKTKLKPDQATYASLLSALSHSGLVEEGLYWFNHMINEYKTQPSEKHYACMVDLLSRAGRVDSALQLIHTMNSGPGIAIWVALLSGCVNHRNFSVGEIAAEKILELRSDDSGIHALVSNFYAMGRRWEEVCSARKIMKNAGMKKVPGYSLVDVNGEMHGFVMEDKSHREHEDIMCVLYRLHYDMRSKESFSWLHS